MKDFKYTSEQLDKIINLLNQVDVKGVNSITAMAMVYQELNNGEVIKEEIDSKIENKEGE